MKYILLLLLSVLMSCSGTPPELGINIHGKLSPCPTSPNCVVSYKNSPDDEHFVDPLKYVGTREASRERLIKALESEGNGKIITNDGNYIRAEYTSAIFRFVDDVEVLFPENEETIHIRSSSRIGHSDLGVNRKRVEMIRFKYHQNEF